MISLTSKQKFGFLILCPDKNVNGLKNTIKSFDQVYTDCPRICLVGNNVTADELKKMNEVCETHKGGETITSLINLGMKKTKVDWNVIVFAGSWVRPIIYKEFQLFVKNDKDILYHVVDRKYNFCEASMNGIIINKNTFIEVGNFPTAPMEKANLNDIELIKLFWSMDAIAKGCTFKAILGMKIV